MSEELAELERRVGGLIERYRDEKRRTQELRGRLDEAQRECARLGGENEQLRGRIGEIEHELSARGEREAQLHGKLQEIIGQIDSLEAEIAGMEGAGDESGETH